MSTATASPVPEPKNSCMWITRPCCKPGYAARSGRLAINGIPFDLHELIYASGETCGWQVIRRDELGFADEFECFGLEFGHGVGLNLHERPIISRLNSLDHPMEIKEGMVFALETYCPATDGYSAARIEEMVVVTAGGCEVMTLFPAEDLPVANAY